MNLSELIARLGLAVVARRLKVKPATVRRWEKHGPSASGLVKVEKVIRRHLASKKASQRRRSREEFRAGLQMPPEPTQKIGDQTSGELSRDEVLPKKRPVETERELKRIRVRAGYDGEEIINTNRYIGESVWLHIGEPVLEVDISELIENVISIWRQSDRTWCHVIFLSFRFFPFNPLYRGEMLKKQGTWEDIWRSTQTWSTERDIRNNIQAVFDGYLNRRGENVQGLLLEAQSRMIWLESVKVRTFDDKEDLPAYRDIMEQQL